MHIFWAPVEHGQRPGARGSRSYMAPEMLAGEGYAFPADMCRAPGFTRWKSRACCFGQFSTKKRWFHHEVHMYKYIYINRWVNIIICWHFMAYIFIYIYMYTFLRSWLGKWWFQPAMDPHDWWPWGEGRLWMLGLEHVGMLPLAFIIDTRPGKHTKSYWTWP